MRASLKSLLVRKPRLRDVAAEAGVGIATVERVVNARGNVSGDTMQRVLIAARKLGYDRAFPAPHHAMVRIEVILVRPDAEFFSRLNTEFLKLQQKVDPLVIVHRSFVDESSPESMARRIREIGVSRAGLIVVGQDHPAIVEAVYWLQANGIPVVLLVSKLSEAPDVPYIGIDNLSAGRTAGFFMKAMLGGKSGKVIALCHSGAYGNHRQRMEGFSQYFSGTCEKLLFSSCMLGGDADDLTEAALMQALSQAEDIIGLYNVGGAHKGVERALKRCKRLGRVAYIGHELSPESRKLLQAGGMVLAIDQMPELQARRAVELLESLIGLHHTEPDYSPVPFRIVTKENFVV